MHKRWNILSLLVLWEMMAILHNTKIPKKSPKPTPSLSAMCKLLPSEKWSYCIHAIYVHGMTYREIARERESVRHCYALAQACVGTFEAEYKVRQIAIYGEDKADI